jgi:tRNA pseudouridine38-40 synthase
VVSRLTLEYDGTDFAGWARQPGQRTVQGELERVIATILAGDVAVTVAGRTDRGVHAWGQVASYPHEALDPVSLNALLPRDVAVLACEPAPPGFDARRDAVSRTYCYRILHRRTRGALTARSCLWVGGSLQLDLLHRCAAALIGTHDFTAFTPTETEHPHFRREVREARWVKRGDELEFWIRADSFLRHMNRTLVGTMLEVAQSRRRLEAFTELLAGRPRAEAGPTVAPHGLALAGVSYLPAPGAAEGSLPASH